MQNVARIVVPLFLTLLVVPLGAQTTSSPPPIAATPPVEASATVSTEGAAATLQTGTEPQKGMSFEEFKQVNAVMLQVAQEDPAIVALSEQLDALIAQREALIVAAACQKNPALAGKIRMMRRNAWEMKIKKSDLDGKAKVQGTSE